MPICIVGEPSDLMPVYVAWLAEERNLDPIWLRESTFGESWSFSLDDQRSDDGQLVVGDRTFRLGDIQGAYVNLNPTPGLPWNLELAGEELNLVLTMRRSTLHSLVDALPCPVANRSHAGRSNNSKPYQMSLLAAAGFAVPEWIVSNDPDVAAAFAARYDDEIIVKSCSGLRSRVGKVGESLQRRLLSGTTPCILQRLIRGHDVRVHTVGDRAFATAVMSDHVDYRFDEGPKTYRPTSIPLEVEALCHAFAAQEQMAIAGFDFKVTPEGRWYCLEMNPVPTFLPYEMETGQKIGDALLDLFVL